MKSRAIVQTGIRQLEMRHYEVPEIGDDDAIMRVEQSGICGSDWSQYKNGIHLTVIPGHEPIGIIEQIGARASERWGVKKGDRVALETMLPCGFCRPCVKGRYNLCRAGAGFIHAYGYKSVDERPSLWGGHADYMYLDPHSLVHKVDLALAPELAVMFNPLGAGVRWASQLPKTAIGETVVILGCGQRGLASVVAAKAAGAGQVIVTGLAVDAHKMEIARAFGADRTVDVEQEDVVAVVREMTNGEMAQVVVEVTSGATQPVCDALDLAAQAGRIVLAGAKYKPVQEFPSNKIMMKELTLIGALAVDFDSYEAAIRIIESRKFPLELMHSHTLPLRDTEKALLTLGNEVAGEQGVHISIDPSL
ncbi:MAG TPA: zinc-binding dehydrogenase [Pseudomonadales bacterium]|jgi:threonine dehydrogenase-like Zn-dependent dehydrogenase|nr:alcohol dehydrogenase catalytic domain-containing protein [Pseudomonadales bacterium]HMU89490.1 zinc-binding dehydrogenase [Pseudomonadales bacterium]HMW14756.1 zinc-binding dehydrogenase [Pseudomonadales bacterium]HMW82907.1 zinc-binding dehydrogenase [Pseudomonadales bacterium]HMY95721.1 zinc-binding dehydrogenase [Pseudomonadales bacterium]